MTMLLQVIERPTSPARASPSTARRERRWRRTRSLRREIINDPLPQTIDMRLDRLESSVPHKSVYVRGPAR